MAAAFELRVLIGLHREARCAVHDGATVGSDTACDIVLSDEGIAPHAGQIRLGQHGWLLSTDESPGGDSADTAWNEARPLGQAWITVAANDAPWVVPDIVAAPLADDAPLAADAPSAGIDRPGPSGSPHTISAASTAFDPSADHHSLLPWPALLVIGAVTLLILSAIGWFAISAGTFTSTATTKSATAEQSLGPIAAALERLGLASSVHATLSKAGTVTVSGWVRDKTQYEAVASAMSQIWPMPAIRVSLESDAIMTARSVLQRFSVKFDPLYQGNGRLSIAGVASSARERADALDAVHAQLPGLTVVGNTIELAQDVSDRLAEKLNALGISGVTLTWQPGHLEVQPPELNQTQDAALEAAIDEFNKQYWDLAQLGSLPAATVADSVPFTIRSIIGGPQPFVVLGDGSKLLIGGIYKKYRLAAVEDTRIIFDGPRRAIITR